MRAVLVVVAVAVLAAGCGSRGKTADEQISAEMANVETMCVEGINCAGDHFQPFRRCTHVSGGFSCRTFFELKDEQTGICRRVGSRWVEVVGAAPGQRGWWRRVVASPDRRALLGQWSGECETQTTYIARGGGAPRPTSRKRNHTPWAGATTPARAFAFWRPRPILEGICNPGSTSSTRARSCTPSSARGAEGPPARL